MLKKTVTYEDYNGETVTDDFYFNLNKVECMELEYSVGANNSLSGSIQTLIDSNDFGTLIAAVKNIVLTAYGVKTPDGKRSNSLRLLKRFIGSLLLTLMRRLILLAV